MKRWNSKHQEDFKEVDSTFPYDIGREVEEVTSNVEKVRELVLDMECECEWTLKSHDKASMDAF